MSRPGSLRALLAAVLLLLQALLPGLHRLQHHDGERGHASCAHDPARGELVWETQVAVPDDCDLCFLLVRGERDFHGAGSVLLPTQGWPLLCHSPLAQVAAPRQVHAPAALPRGPPSLLS